MKKEESAKKMNRAQADKRMQAEIRKHAKSIPLTDMEKNPYKYHRSD